MNPIKEFIHNEEFVNTNKDSLIAAYMLIDDIENKLYRRTNAVGIAAGLKDMWAKRVAEMNNNGESALTAAYDEALATDEATLAAAAIEVVEEIKKVLIKLLKSHELVPPLTRDVIIQVCKHVKHRVPLSHPYWRTNNCIVNAIGQVLLGGEGLYDSELFGQKKSPVSNNVIEFVPATAAAEIPVETIQTAKEKLNAAIVNIQDVAENSLLRGKHSAHYGELFRHKLRTYAEGYRSVAIDNQMPKAHDKALELSNDQILNYINTLVKALRNFIATLDENSSNDTAVLLELFYNYLTTHQHLIHLDMKTKAIAKEFFKVIACEGRLFTWNAAPDEYEPVLIAVDKIFEVELEKEI